MYLLPSSPRSLETLTLSSAFVLITQCNTIIIEAIQMRKVRNSANPIIACKNYNKGHYKYGI